MAEHAETFLSLYKADMDTALQVQPVDSWDSFPLFQLLNNFLRTDRESHLFFPDERILSDSAVLELSCGLWLNSGIFQFCLILVIIAYI